LGRGITTTHYKKLVAYEKCSGEPWTRIDFFGMTYALENGHEIWNMES
jgi:hypothetical protein